MAEPEFIAAFAPVVAVLDELGVAYYVAGSIVSSRYGVARATADVDLVAELRREHAPIVEAALLAAYGGASDRQWGDVLGVLRVQTGRLDLDHMRRWSRDLGVEDLLDRALAEAAT